MPDGVHAKNIQNEPADFRSVAAHPKALLFTACPPRLSSSNHPGCPSAAKGDPYWHHPAIGDSGKPVTHVAIR
jgi:hypothetical protein